ncbi:MAG TPA: hypothetical protein VM142_07950 [Acidimicrobiales bacterium]|nr:hypothetical protein [Acidimicrobiales bacterium]
MLTDVGTNEIDYVEAMANKGVLNFGSFNGKQASFFQKFPKLVWGYQPNLERQAESFSTYVCTKVVKEPTSMSSPDVNGKPRKLGLWHTEDDSWPGLIFLAELVKKKVEDCGGEIVAEHTFPVCCLAQDNGTRPDYAVEAMADFKQKGVTTILWTGGIEGNAGKAATASAYFPEWILLGDGTFDTNWPVRLSTHSQAFDRHAVTVSAETLEPGLRQQRCYQAFREVNTTRPDIDMPYICTYYRNLFQLFTGIQVAGPRLGPTSVDNGFHAIPAIRSNDPSTPACYYEAGDYTCVKDTQAEWWDANGQAPDDGQPGCWRAIQRGKRYLPGEWPSGNINAQITEADPCNGRSVRVLYSPT